MGAITFDPDCISCGLFTALDDLSMRYGREVFEALAPATREAFASFIGLWFAYQLLYKGLFRGELSFQELLPKLALFALLHAALMTSQWYWDFVYLPIKETTSAVSQVVVLPAGADVADKSFAGLLKVVETQVRRVLDLAIALLKDAGVLSFHLGIAGLLLALPYLFVWCVFLAFMLEGMFKLLAITVLAPLAIICAGFAPTRGFAISAVRVVLGGALTVVFAAVAMGFTVAVLRFYTGPDVVPIGPDGKIAVRAAAFVFSPQYLAIFVLGFISILFHLKAATLAANISGASDGPGAAATVVGAGMATIAAAKGLAMAPARRYGGQLLDKFDQKAGDRLSQGANRLIDRFTGGGKPAEAKGNE